MGFRYLASGGFAVLLAACTPPLELALTNLSGADVTVANDRDALLRTGERTVFPYPSTEPLRVAARQCAYTYLLHDYIPRFPHWVGVKPPELRIEPDFELQLLPNAVQDGLPGTGDPAAFPIAPSQVRCG